MVRDRNAEALRRLRIVRLLMPVAVAFFGVQAIVEFVKGMTLAAIALTVCAAASAAAGVLFYVLRNVATAPSWPTESVEPTAGTGVVTVRRLPAPSRDRLRAYNVVLDGAAVGAVRDGDVIHCPTPAGDHVIRITIDWSGSLPLTFSLAAGETVAFECEPSVGGPSAAILDLVLHRPLVQVRESSSV